MSHSLHEAFAYDLADWIYRQRGEGTSQMERGIMLCQVTLFFFIPV